MKVQSIAAFAVFLIFLSAPFLVFVSTTDSNGATIANLPSPSFAGTVNIWANGVVNYSGSGNNNIISLSGNTYTLNGNLYGNINFFRNNSVFDGNGFSIFNGSHPEEFTFNLTHTHNVEVKNLAVNASYNQGGVYVANSTYIDLSNLNISASVISLDLGVNTSHVNVSGSNFSMNQKSVDNYTIIGSGLITTNHGPTLTNSTSYVSFTDDHVYGISNSSALFSELFVNSNHTVISGLHLSGGTTFGIILNSSNILVTDNSLIGHFSYNGILSNFGFSYQNNITISDNLLNLSTVSYNISPTAISTYSKASIQNNRIYMNLSVTPIPISGIDVNQYPSQVDNNTLLMNSASNEISGITYYGVSNFTAYGNYIEINQTENGTFSYGIEAYGGNATLSHNSLYLKNVYTGISMSDRKSISTYNKIVDSGNNKFTAINFPLPQNSVVNHNNIQINTVNNAYAITPNGGNITISNNAIEVSSQINANGIISHAPGNGSLNATGNSITFGKSTQEYGIVSYAPLSNFTQNISQNVLNLINGINIVAGIGINNANNSIVSGNYIHGTTSLSPSTFEALQVSNFQNSSISNNVLLGNNSNIPGTMGFNFKAMYNTSVENNSISEFNYSMILLDSSHNVFLGNYFNNSYYGLNLNRANYTTFYHNDFINYKNKTLSISQSSNDQFNSTLPIGGNYWQSYTGTDGNNDGIGDTPFTVNGTFIDQYPLMKPWTRPQAIFYAPAGINGTQWNVTFNGQTVQSTNDTISFNILNGTYQQYNYSYYNNSLYYLSDFKGTTEYTGNSISVNVPYLHYSYITGQLNVSNVTVFVNGKQIAVSSGAFNLTVTAGNYTVVVKATGYDTFNHTYNVTPGETLRINPALVRIPGNAFNPMLKYAAAAVAVVAVLAGTLLFMRGRKKP